MKCIIYCKEGQMHAKDPRVNGGKPFKIDTVELAHYTYVESPSFEWGYDIIDGRGVVIAPFILQRDVAIEKVVFNDPATIVFWTDGTKTVIKCQEGDIFDKEKGLAMAISKKYFGNKGNYCDIFKKWCHEDEEECDTFEFPRANKDFSMSKYFAEMGDTLVDAFQASVAERMKK